MARITTGQTQIIWTPVSELFTIGKVERFIGRFGAIEDKFRDHAAYLISESILGSLVKDEPMNRLDVFTTAELSLPARHSATVASVIWDREQEDKKRDWKTYGEFRNSIASAVRSQESETVKPIRLGGREVEPLEIESAEGDLLESARAVMESSPIRPDLAMVLLSLGFTYDQAACLSIRHLDNLNWIETGAALGRTPKETQALRRACTRKILEVRESGLPPAGRPGRLRIGHIDWPAGCFEQLESGRYIWAAPR